MELLINDIKTLKSYLGGVQRNMEFLTWKPFVEQATEKWLLPAFGEELLADLAGDVTGVKAELKKKIQRALALYSHLVAIPQMTTVTGDAGILQPNPGNSTVITKWMFVNLVVTTTRSADDALEGALQYLDKKQNEKLEDGETFLFAAWRSSEVFLAANKMFVRSATELTKYLPMSQNSRRMFLTMVPYLEAVERDVLPNFFGAGFIEAMRERIAGDEELTLIERVVLDNLRMILIYQALADSLVYLNLSEDFRVVTTTDGLTNEGMLDSQKATQIKLDCERAVEKHYNKLRDYLNGVASETVFPEYFESEFCLKLEKPQTAKERVAKRFEDKGRNFVIL